MAVTNLNWPVVAWDALFSGDPNTPLVSGTAWSSLSGRVEGANVGYGGQYELDAVEAGAGDLAVLNGDEALNPLNTGSAFNSGGNVLRPWQRIIGSAQWPATSGNLLNATNAARWGYSAVSSTLEGGIGGWTAAGTTPPTVAASTVRAFQGTGSMLVTWPTATNGGLPAVSAATVGFLGPLKTGETYTASIYLWAAAGVPKMRLWVDGAGSAAVSGTFASAWQRVTLTFTATGPWVGLWIYPDTNTTTGQQVWVDAAQIDLGASASAYATTGPVIYPLFAGYIERYPLGWSAGGYLGRANLGLVDASAVLARIELPDVTSCEIRADAPVLTFRLDDAAGKTKPKAANWSAAVSVGVQAFNDGSNRPDFGFARVPDIDGSTSVDFNPDSATAYVTLLGVLNGTAGDYTSASIEFWFRRNTIPANRQVIVTSQEPNNGQYLEIGVDSGGLVYAREVNNPATPTYHYTLANSAPVTDDEWHHVVWTTSRSGASTKTATLYVDGVAVGSTTGTWSIGATNGNSVHRPYAVWLGGPVLPASTGQAYDGQLSWFSVYWSTLSPTRLAQHIFAAQRGHARDLPGARLLRALTWGGWNGPTSIPDQGTGVMGPASGYSGRTLADIAQECAATDGGYVVCLPDGDLSLVTRRSFTAQTSSSLTFGEDTTAGEIPYTDDIGFDLDPTYIYNEVEVTGAGGVTSGVASDATSQARYFRSSLQIVTALAREDDALPYRDWVLNRMKAPSVRVTAITINPAANPSLWPVALGTFFGQRVTVKRRTAAFTMTRDFYVLHRQHQYGPGVWKTTFQLVPADTRNPFIPGDAVYGRPGLAADNRLIH